MANLLMPIFNAAYLLYPKESYRIIQHVIFWTLLFLLRFYLTLITFNVYSGLPVSVKAMSCLFGTGFIAAFYYVLVNGIWKHILRKKKYLTTFIIIIALLVGYTVADTLTERLILNTCKGCMVSLVKDQPSYYNLVSSDITNIVLKRLVSFGTPFSLILTLFIPLCLKTTLNAYRRSIDSLKLAKENVQLEFNFLKAQLNPHFLFNTMNNIYGLIMSGDKGRSADLVSRLSELLRYILYDSNEDSMPLAREIKLINDYIELEKVRLNFTKVVFNYSMDDGNYQIAPLLLIPLIENSFKFSPDEPGSLISIFLDVLNGRLRFTVDNRIDPQRIKAGTGGIGLKNLQKRLSLYYRDSYLYAPSISATDYSVDLTIQLT